MNFRILLLSQIAELMIRNKKRPARGPLVAPIEVLANNLTDMAINL
jgi:hypothetical protein